MKTNTKSLSTNLKSSSKTPLGIYVHIPFCHSKCRYCNFCSYVLPTPERENTYERYTKALLKQFADWAPRAKNYEVTTIYFGGGTPSILGEYLVPLLAGIYKNFTVSPSAEISLEANPNAIELSHAVAWKNAGFNRVSVGLQSGNDNLLKILGRTHTQQDFLQAISILKQAGFENISADVMIGLPTQTVTDVQQTLQLLFDQNLQHISCYSLILEPETPLSEWVQTGQLKMVSDDEAVDMYDAAHQLVHAHGFERYEVSNFCKSGYACRHNQNTWNGTPYLGFGVAAHSFFEQERFSNVLQTANFIEKIAQGKSPILATQKLTNQDQMEETIMLSLRCADGLDLQKFEQRFGMNLLQQKKQTVDALVRGGFLAVQSGRLFATDAGFHVLNQLILQLLP